MGEDPRLPRAGPGQDQQRSLAERHRLPLGRVQVFEQALDVVRPGLNRGTRLDLDRQFFASACHGGEDSPRPGALSRCGCCWSAPETGAEQLAELLLLTAEEGRLHRLGIGVRDRLPEAVDHLLRCLAISRRAVRKGSGERRLVEVDELIESIELPLVTLLDQRDRQCLPVERAAREGSLGGRGVAVDLDRR